jgi:UDP-N-acetylglucosamine--N-acetylmuramyl-(pentapeptide) pyrophosphoryl-undecaprenol N-acetylglucosamine transferase
MTKRIILVAGGTGGHVFPAVAIAEYMILKGHDVFLITDQRGERYIPETLLKRALILKERYPQSILEKVKALLGVFPSAFRTVCFFRKVKPDVIWGFGGRLTYIPLLISRWLGVPSGIYQSDKILGRANRKLLSQVRAIATGFKDLALLPKGIDKAWVGFPVRQSFEVASYPKRTYKSDPFCLLVLGGSQGAAFFSSFVPQAIALLSKAKQSQITVYHQCSLANLQHCEELYKETEAQVSIQPFFDPLGSWLAQAHLVIARAGASTLGELAYVGRPALFIPYPYATQDHQMHNAQSVVEQGGGWLISQKDACPEKLRSILNDALDHPLTLEKKAQAITSMNLKNPTQTLTSYILSFCSVPKRRTLDSKKMSRMGRS